MNVALILVSLGIVLVSLGIATGPSAVVGRLLRRHEVLCRGR
jgi:hypothetical protein